MRWYSGVWSDVRMDRNTKDTLIFAMRCITVMVCGALSLVIPQFVLGV